ncbi:MAG: alpha-glucosidase [Lachnospiraceae bacterium]|nr:alpha-glucosidase [Lachnospiraceae bacterium]
MIRRFVFGSPLETDSVIDKPAVCAGELQYFEKHENVLTFRMGKDDIVYGLGENVRGINKRGWRYVSNCTDDPHHNEGTVSLYGAHNFLLIEGPGHCPAGIFIDTPAQVSYDVGYTRSDMLEIRIDNEDYELYEIDGETPAAVVKDFRGIIGRPYLPPRWAFGYGQSRWSYLSADEVRQVAAGFQGNQIPIDSIYLDIDYMEGYKDFTINRETFPDFEELVSEMRAQGIHLVPIIDGGVKAEEGYEVCEEGLENGYFCQDENGENFTVGVWPGLCYFPDMLNEDAARWFGRKYQFLLDKGIDGFWNDMNEPAIFYSGRRLNQLFAKMEDCVCRRHLLSEDRVPAETAAAADTDGAVSAAGSFEMGSPELTDTEERSQGTIIASAAAQEPNDLHVDTAEAAGTSVSSLEAADTSAGSPKPDDIIADGLRAADISSYYEIRMMVEQMEKNPEDYRSFYHHYRGEKIRHDKVHNLFGYYMTRAAGEAFEELAPDRRILLFSRSSCVGMHRYGGIWTGDNSSWWSHLQMNLKMLPSLNMCGFLYVGADIGGFTGDVTEDLLLRWLALGIFTPLMRNHSAMGTRRQEPYTFAHTDAMAGIIGLRYRLLPYLYSEFMKAALNNEMYALPLGFIWTGDEIARRVEDQLMIGESIMIAPVCEQNATGRVVYLPEEMKLVRFAGTVLKEETIVSAGHHYIPVALDEVVFFIRRHHILPICPGGKNTESADFGDISCLHFADEGDAYELYEDDGISREVTLKGHIRRIGPDAC